MTAETSSSKPSSQGTVSDSGAMASDAQSSPTLGSTAEPTPGFGWTRYAEQINGRFAMVGFILLLLLELFTRQDFFTWIGLR